MQAHVHAKKCEYRTGLGPWTTPVNIRNI